MPVKPGHTPDGRKLYDIQQPKDKAEAQADSKQVNVRLNRWLYWHIVRASNEEDKSMSAYLRDLLTKHFEKVERDLENPDWREEKNRS